jgi:hypothetical protein
MQVRPFTDPERRRGISDFPLPPEHTSNQQAAIRRDELGVTGKMHRASLRLWALGTFSLQGGAG